MPTKKQLSHAAILAMLLLGAALFLPHIHTGYTTHDDARTAIDAWQTGNLFERPVGKAKSSGRINQIVNTPIDWLPYLGQNDGLYQLLRLGGAFFPFLLFSWVVGRCSNSPALGFASGCAALGLYQNNWQHNLLNAYPFCYQMGFCLVLLAFWCHYRACKQGRPSWAVLGGACLLIAFLIYEAFFAYLPLLFFLTVVWRRFETPRSLRLEIKPWLPYLFPMLGAAGLFLTSYLGFRMLYPSEYPGVALSLSSPLVLLRTLIQFIIGTVPTLYFFIDSYTVNQVFTGWEPFAPNIGILLANLESAWVLKAGIFTAAMIYFLPVAAQDLRKSGMIITAITGLFMVVLPFVLISLTPKYQEWARQGTVAYVPSYFAFFGTALMIVMVLVFVYRRFSNRFWLNWIFGSLLFTAALLIGAANDYYARDQEQSHLKWRTVDSLLNTPAFQALPDRSVILAPGLWKKRGIVDMRHDRTYWSDYFSAKTGKKITVVRSTRDMDSLKTDASTPFYLDLLRDHRHLSVAVLFSKLPSPLKLAANEVSLFTAGPHRRYQVIGRFIDKSKRFNTKVWIDDDLLAQACVGAAYFSAWVNRFKDFEQATGEEPYRKTFVELVKMALEDNFAKIFATPPLRSEPNFPFVLTRISSERYVDLESFNISYQQPSGIMRP